MNHLQDNVSLLRNHKLWLSQAHPPSSVIIGNWMLYVYNWETNWPNNILHSTLCPVKKESSCWGTLYIFTVTWVEEQKHIFVNIHWGKKWCLYLAELVSPWYLIRILMVSGCIILVLSLWGFVCQPNVVPGVQVMSVMMLISLHFKPTSAPLHTFRGTVVLPSLICLLILIPALHLNMSANMRAKS